jgi:hypothetical protein
MRTSVKSTVRIDPVQGAIIKADRYAADGDWAKAIECLEGMHQEYPEREDLESRLRELRALEASSATVAAGGSGKLWVGVTAVAVVGAVVWFLV